MASTTSLVFCLWLVAKFSLCGSVLLLNSSHEFQLRRFLFDTHPFDKSVRPVVEMNETLRVNFTLSLISLNNVDIKKQYIDVDLWVTMKWYNPYMRWRRETFGGINRIEVKADSIWTPDVFMVNNVDDDNPVAGGPKKFINPVVLLDDGTNIWFSPANFKAYCQVDIISWPFDNQTCSLYFGSLSKSSEELELNPVDNDDIAKNTAENGEWKIAERISVTSINSKHGCCTFNSSNCLLTFKVTRRTSYHMVYLVLPCLVLVTLTLVSFAIPSESGERIGFCTTLLLAMAVYLLLVAQSVPEASNQVPVLGKFFIASFMEIFAALVSTIVVLSVYHKPGKPGPKWQKVFGCGTIVCLQREKRMKTSAAQPVRKEPVKNIAEPVVEESVGNDEGAVSSQPKEKDTKLSWRDISESLNRVMFCMVLLFLIMWWILLAPLMAP